LLRDNIQFQLFGSSDEEPTAVPGAGAYPDTSRSGRNLVNWLPNSTAYLKQLTEIA